MPLTLYQMLLLRILWTQWYLRQMLPILSDVRAIKNLLKLDSWNEFEVFITVLGVFGCDVAIWIQKTVGSMFCIGTDKILLRFHFSPTLKIIKNGLSSKRLNSVLSSSISVPPLFKTNRFSSRKKVFAKNNNYATVFKENIQ